MAIIRVEEYACDFCGKPVALDEVLVGTLAVRKLGARGRQKEVALSMHPRCIPVPVIPGANGRRTAVRRSRTAAKA